MVGTGRTTAIGRIAEQVEEAGETGTPLQRRIQQLAVWITWGILVIAAISLGVGLLMGRDWSRMVILAVALAVAAIPAGLPIVVTVALAIGVRRMAEEHAVIRHLPAVDTLGSCTTIVSDKTGTLTQNRMTVRGIYAAGETFDVTGAPQSADGGIERDGKAVAADENQALHETLLAGVLCNDAELPETEERESEERGATGDPMEIALLYAAKKASLDPKRLREHYPLEDKVPFQTERRFMATLHEETQNSGQSPSSPLVILEGAPEAVLRMCSKGAHC